MLQRQTQLKPAVPQLHAIQSYFDKSVPSPGQKQTRQASHQLWLHIHLPQFALEVLNNGNIDQQACVLIEGQGKRLKILQANKQASRLGVRLGMPLGAAEILGDLKVLSRDERAEKHALERLCAWAYQFTSIVSAEPSDGLLLEVKGSLRLFGGLDELLGHLRRGLRELGYRATIAIAPTPSAATALARAEQQKIILSQDELSQALRDIPLDVLRLTPQQLSTLDSIGVRSIGDCLRLPRAGLGRRTTPKLLETFQRLLGQAAEPRTHFALPKLFRSSLEIPWETKNAQALGVAGEKLLHELVGYLRASSAMTRRLRWSLTYTAGHASHFQLDLTQASRDHAHFALLLREQLSRIKLTGKIRNIALYVDDIACENLEPTTDLFQQHQQSQAEDWSSFLDRLRARLGEKAVKGLQRVSDHRPECAWRWSNLAPASDAKSHQQNAGAKQSARPLWLMKRPIRLSGETGELDINGPLHFLEDRERIETGWWDGKPVGRDYFVAANPNGARLWIYRELSGAKNWYLHGIFE